MQEKHNEINSNPVEIAKKITGHLNAKDAGNFAQASEKGYLKSKEI
ncbi:hypothetical protein [Legionella sp.]